MLVQPLFNQLWPTYSLKIYLYHVNHFMYIHFRSCGKLLIIWKVKGFTYYLAHVILQKWFIFLFSTGIKFWPQRKHQWTIIIIPLPKYNHHYPNFYEFSIKSRSFESGITGKDLGRKKIFPWKSFSKMTSFFSTNEIFYQNMPHDTRTFSWFLSFILSNTCCISLMLCCLFLQILAFLYFSFLQYTRSVKFSKPSLLIICSQNFRSSLIVSIN